MSTTEKHFAKKFLGFSKKISIYLSNLSDPIGYCRYLVSIQPTNTYSSLRTLDNFLAKFCIDFRFKKPDISFH